MRTFLLAAAATLFAATPVAAQTSMTPQEREAFRADWRSWSHCAVLGALFSGDSDNPQDRADFANKARSAEARGAALAATKGVSRDTFDAETMAFVAELQATAQSVVMLTGEMLQCQEAGLFDLSAAAAPAAPAPRSAAPPPAAPAASAPLGYTLALSVNGQGGGVTYTRTAVPGQLDASKNLAFEALI